MAAFHAKVAFAMDIVEDTADLGFIEETPKENQPIFRILYTASTKGELFPCPT